MINSSTCLIKLLINLILSLTFAPPKMANTGLVGSVNTLSKYSNSFFIKNPATLCSHLIPTIELCALCAVPKASLTKISPKCVKEVLNLLISSLLGLITVTPSLSSPFPSSSA